MSSGVNLLQSSYPQNLLYAITEGTELLLPPVLSKDHMAGLHYALSTLDEQEYAILLQLYRQHAEYQKIGQMLCLPIKLSLQLWKSCAAPHAGSTSSMALPDTLSTKLSKNMAGDIGLDTWTVSRILPWASGAVAPPTTV